MKKKCNGCNRVLDKKFFNKNRNNKDGLSFYCKECIKKHKDLYFFKNTGNKQYEYVIIDELKRHNIPIEGVDKDKINNLVICMSDYPGVISSLLDDLPKFLKKYDLTYEEYKVFVKACNENKFWIRPKGLNT